MKKSLFILSITTMTILSSGCVAQGTKGFDVVKKIEPKIVVPKEDFDTNLEDVLKEKGNFVDIKGLKQEYKEGEDISFVIDTKGRIGYLYIMSVDDSSVTILQPNPNSPLSQMRGVRSFPTDFTNGTFDIQATKNCKGCKDEKTTIYVLLTKQPISGIEKEITGDKLLSFYKNSQKAKQVTRGVKLNLHKSSSPSNLSIGKSDFFVN